MDKKIYTPKKKFNLFNDYNRYAKKIRLKNLLTRHVRL